jgi:hypothetical protein
MKMIREAVTRGVTSMILLIGIRDHILRNLLVITLLFILWMMCPKPFHKHMHLQMQNIAKMLFVVRWTLMSNGTWEITDCLNGCKPIGCKWIFKNKLRPDGTIEKYKPRLVAKGFMQKE